MMTMMMNVIIYISFGMLFWVILPPVGVTGIVLKADKVGRLIVVPGFTDFPMYMDIVATIFTGASAVRVHRN